MKSKRPLLWIGGTLLGSFAFFAVLLALVGKFGLCYLEQMMTFFYDSHWVAEQLARRWGFLTLPLSFVAQFFINPVQAVVVASIALSLFSTLVAVLLRWASRSWMLTPLALLPAVALAMVVINYTPANKPLPFVNLPWYLLAAVLAVAVAVRWLRASKAWRIAFLSVSGIAAAAFTAFAVNFYADPMSEAFKELNYYSRHAQWQKIIDRCQSLPMENLLFQNFANMAYAEEGVLLERLYDNPVIDIRSIYAQGEKSPMIYMMLSDIYYSMGHIALAQKHAFEANESLHNYSPAMLQRLAITNTLTANHPVARKYLSLLSRTLYYKPSEPSPSEPGACTVIGLSEPEVKAMPIHPIPDRFSALHGLDDDLREIARANPHLRTTPQYLAALYLLSRNRPAYEATLQEFFPQNP